jgi:hypothetical protein
MIGSQEACAGAIILQGNPLEELMQVQGEGISQVYLLLEDKGEGLRKTSFTKSSGRSSHLLSMVSTRKEKR